MLLDFDPILWIGAIVILVWLLTPIVSLFEWLHEKIKYRNDPQYWINKAKKEKEYIEQLEEEEAWEERKVRPKLTKHDQDIWTKLYIAYKAEQAGFWSSSIFSNETEAAWAKWSEITGKPQWVEPKDA